MDLAIKSKKTLIDVEAEIANLKRLAGKIIPNLRYLPQSQVRTCNCCERMSVIASFSNGEETKLCIRCRANLRYEMLATVIRSLERPLEEMIVLELDPHSPLRQLLCRAKIYHRSYYSGSEERGSIRADGVRCEDITRLTFPSSSLDLIVSSDVLEHVPDIEAAFRESYRVLAPGGCHIFTVPNRSVTFKRAEIIDGQIKHLTQPDYHSDPLNRQGILAFWDFGADAVPLFSSSGLKASIIAGPKGKDERVVWKAAKSQKAALAAYL